MFFIQNQQGDRAQDEAQNGTMNLTAADKNTSMKHRLRKDMAALDLPPEVVIDISNGEDGEENL